MEFGSKFDIRKDKQYLVAYTEENHPNVYSTAFVFLTFLGLGRNMSLILFLMIILSDRDVIFKILIGVVIIVFLAQFILFKVYFESHILSAYILSENKESKEMEE